MAVLDDTGPPIPISSSSQLSLKSIVTINPKHSFAMLAPRHLLGCPSGMEVCYSISLSKPASSHIYPAKSLIDISKLAVSTPLIGYLVALLI